ncbi:MAG: DinB family protein [Sphingobacteriales bacterium]|nr:MAG: DinB family protein [Sphingobacteriales bacterium]
MKKVFIAFASLVLVSFTQQAGPITEKEKTDAAKFLSETEDGVLASVKGLSEAQLNFKPAPDKWSVEDCMKHIAVTEASLWQMTNKAISDPANPEKRSEIKMSDADVMKNIESRANKVKTMPPFEPQNTSYKSMDEAIASFKENRGKLIDYIKGTNADLRNHVLNMGFASFDAYQMILFIGAHSNRHMQQINEVKADPNFPKN